MIFALLLSLFLSLGVHPEVTPRPDPKPPDVKRHGVITIEYQFDTQTNYYVEDKKVKFEDVDFDKYEADEFVVDHAKKHVDKLVFKKKK